MNTEDVSIIRAPRTKDRPYFSMCRASAQDERLSWEARGVLAYLLSKPDDWQVQVKDLQQKCGRDKAKAILKELLNAKYLAVKQEHDLETGKFLRNHYQTYETPFTENPSTAEPLTANTSLTDKRQEQIIDKKKNTPKSPKGDSKPRPQSAQGKRLQYWQENAEALEVIRHGLRPGLPVTVLNETDVKALIALHQDGERMAIPAARYPRLFAYLRRKFDWKANYVPTISDARKYIGEWWAIEKATPVIVPQHPIQPAPERAKPGEIISREAQEEARRIFEDLVKLKDANG